MKTRLMNPWLKPLKIACICGVATTALIAFAPDKPDVLQLREKAARLQREASELKAEGKAEQARDLVRQAEELRAQAAAPGRREGRPAGARPQEMKRQLEQAMGELKELRAAGKEEEALKLKRHIQELEMALERSAQPRSREGVRPPGRPLRARGAELPPRHPEMQQLRHLQAAIENLRAAGMHEPAERLAQHAEMLRHRTPGAPGFRPDGMQPPPGADGLRAEIQELRQAVRELRQRVEELSRAEK